MNEGKQNRERVRERKEKVKRGGKEKQRKRRKKKGKTYKGAYSLKVLQVCSETAVVRLYFPTDLDDGGGIADPFLDGGGHGHVTGCVEAFKLAYSRMRLLDAVIGHAWKLRRRRTCVYHVHSVKSGQPRGRPDVRRWSKKHGEGTHFVPLISVLWFSCAMCILKR
jgi:hypothetical protein